MKFKFPAEKSNSKIHEGNLLNNTYTITNTHTNTYTHTYTCTYRYTSTHMNKFHIIILMN